MVVLSPAARDAAAMEELDLFARFCGELVLESGARMVLEDFQRTILLDYFEGVTETLVLLSKKNGKTSLIAALALYHLFTTPDAECVIGASSRDQARILFRQAAGLVTRSGLGGKDGPYAVKSGYGEIQSRFDSGRIRVMAADANTGDGVIPTLAVVDELHRHRNADLYGVFRDGLGPRNGRIVTISTAGADEETPLGRMRKAAYALPSFRREGSAYRYARSDGFAFHEWALDPGSDTDDIDLVKEANPASWQTVARLRERHDSPTMMTWQWLRFACGIWVRGFESWIPRWRWDERSYDQGGAELNAAGPDGHVPPRVSVVLAFDGCLDDQTEVLTESGWKPFDEYRGERIATLGPTGHVEWHRPTRFIAYWHEGEMLRISGLTVDLLVTPDHDLYLSGERIKASEIEAAWPTTRTFRSRWQTQMDAEPGTGAEPEAWPIPTAAYCGTGRPLKPLGDVPIGPLLRLMGYYIAEGSLWKRRGVRRGIVLSQYRKVNPDVYADMVRSLVAVGVNPAQKPRAIVGMNRSFAEFLYRECGEYSYGKRVPEWVFGLHPRLVKILFEAYLDGDGSTHRGGQRSAGTNSRQLADDLQRIALHLGFAATVRQQNWFVENRGVERPGYGVGFLERRTRPHLRRRPEREPYSGMVYDVTVANHVFYVRRNGKPTWTGNSFNGDSTGLVACTIPRAVEYDGAEDELERDEVPEHELVPSYDGPPPHLDVVACWERPEDAGDDWTVPVLDVEKAVKAACRKWKVREIACDSTRWQRSLEVLKKMRLPVADYPQRPARMIPATTRLHSAVMRADNGVTHSGDERLGRHVENAIVKITEAGGQVAKPSKTSPLRIDLAVCAIMAFDRAHFYIGRGSATVVDPSDILGDDDDSGELADLMAEVRAEYAAIIAEDE